MGNNKSIIIYTDGASSGNPGPGGYGIVFLSGKHRKEISAGYRRTTNNRMELLAVIVALEQLRYPNSEVTIYTDSKYVADAVNKEWVFKWEQNRFKKKKNSDLWKRFLQIYRKHSVTLNWVKGHSDTKENQRCDELAVKAYKNNNLLIDEVYENSEINS